MKNTTPYILGLDIGSNSVGWAVVDCELEKGNHQGIYAGYNPTSLRALNSRIFLGMVEAKTQVPKNQKRRAARGARNRRSYYKKRRRDLLETLLETGLLPSDYLENPEQTLNRIDRKFAESKLNKKWSKAWSLEEKAYCSPYAMRCYALEDALRPHELGRLLLHLQRRRGYFSNRGAKYVELIKHLALATPQDDEQAMTNEDKKETGAVLAAISELGNRLKGRTIGQFIWQESQAAGIPPQRITLFRYEQTKERKGEITIERLQLRAQREMYEQEFEAIWEKQKGYLSQETQDSINKIKEAIFHQRPLQLQKTTVGNCNIYPNKKRVAVMRLEFQAFRTLQVVNKLKIDESPLTSVQREQLLSMANDPDQLNKQGRVAWKDVAKVLGVRSKRLNFNRQGDEGEGKTGLVGNRTAQAISQSIGSQRWHDLGKEKQWQLVEDLLSINNKRALYERLVNHWKFKPWNANTEEEESEALALAMNEQLEDGYGKHSLKAINALLPHLHEGLDYYRAMEKIGKADTITPLDNATDEAYLLQVEDVPNVANPIVQKALYEIRRVVNSIIKRYGKPAIIRMEMAREMKSSKKHRTEIASQQKANRKRNEEAETEILKHATSNNPNIELKTTRTGMRSVKSADRNKYKMWKHEQNEQCPYCQEPIGFNQLFSGEAEIEHILPYTGFRQNYMNTLVSCMPCNQSKGQRTPFDAWGADSARWERIEKFAKEKYVKELYAKQRNILKKKHVPEAVDDFVQRQLNDTRYIATATKEMLKQYGIRIDVNNGAATSELRRKLGLNSILPRDPAAGVYTETGEQVDTATGEILKYNAAKAAKSRQDHRHHAVDAFVVAITDRAMLKSMVDAHQIEHDQKRGNLHQKTREDWIREKRLVLPKSWKDSDVLHSLLDRKLNATVVSHMTKRKVWGALHEETRYRKSHFSQKLNIEGMRTNILKQVRRMVETDQYGDQDWVADDGLRAVLLQWASEALAQKSSERSLPRYNDRELKEIDYQTPCMTTRKELNGELLASLAKEWAPGTGTWIAEKSIHDSLYKWLTDNNQAGKKASEIDAVLRRSPPRLPNKRGKTVPVYRVRVARVMSEAYVKIATSYVETGSNHHFVLFNNGKDGKERERKICMVSMLEAAQLASVGKPVINRMPPSEWEGQWQYELDLCVNDMVCCQDLSIFENGKIFAPQHRETPYFRVQNMNSKGDKKIDMTLRHHSVSGTDSSWGKWRISSLSKIACKRVQVGNLGLLPDDS